MTTRAKLPGLPAPNFADPAIQRWAQAVSERLEVREGARGDHLERVVTWRDLGMASSAQGRVTSPSLLSGTAQIPIGNGQTINIDMATFSEQLKSTQLYRDLQTSINDPLRFSRLGQEVNEYLTRSLTAEAAARSAQIARNDVKITELTRSIAATTTELTAALDTTAAGIRSTQFAIATDVGATAGQVTTLQARLQVEINPEDLLPVPPAAAYANLSALTTAVPAASADTRKYYRVTDGAGEVLYRSNGTAYSLVGTEESAKLEEVLLVTADKSLGLESQYTLKVNAGNAIAGFGIAATERDGVPSSAFNIQADKFALSVPFTFSQESTPSATVIGQTWYKPSTEVSYRATNTGTGGWVVYTPIVPFGVDTTTGTVYISGTVRVGAGGGTALTTVDSNASNGAAAYTAVVDPVTGLTPLNATALNFNNRNDRNATAVVAPTIAGDGTAIDHTVNTDGSVDISFEWSWAGTEADIDGFIVTTYTSTTDTAYTFGTTPAAESEYFMPASKRAMIGYGFAADLYYKLSVQAYRIVDPDVNAAGIIRSTRAIPSLVAENPYRPAANIAFGGDITGTVNSVAVGTLTAQAANGNAAYSAVIDGTSGLATKLGLASRNVLTGSGGIAVGSINWNTSGVVNSGYGVAITNNGIMARNAALATTFVLDGTTGNATFAGELSAATGTFAGALSAATGTFAGTLSAATGTFAGALSAATGTFAGALSAATGTFSGNISTSGQVTATGTTPSAEGDATVVGASATSGVRGGVFIATNTSGVVGVSTSGAGVYGKTSATSATSPGVLGSSGAGGIAIATEVGSIQINSTNSNMIIGTATNTGNNNLVIKEGVVGSRLDNQMLIYGALSTDADTTLGLVTEQGVVAGTGAFVGILQIRIVWNGAEYWLPLQAV